MAVHSYNPNTWEARTGPARATKERGESVVVVVEVDTLKWRSVIPEFLSSKV